jgi:PPOX class probable F420-dependent enzyme
MDEDEARQRFAAAPVAVLATVDSGGAPHAVPVVFAVDGDTLWTATDAKPKRGRALRRYANVRANPAVSLLVQHWDEDWSALWWVRADGLAAVHEAPAAVAHAVGLLRAKYPQYGEVDVHGPVLEIAVRRWRGWP